MPSGGGSAFSPIRLLKGAGVAIASMSLVGRTGAASTKPSLQSSLPPSVLEQGLQPQCEALPCAPVPPFWAASVDEVSTTSMSPDKPSADVAAGHGQESLPFCTSTFTGIYEAALKLQSEGKPALPYLPSDATDGIRREFGTELEFDFEKGVSREKGLVMLQQIADDFHAHHLIKSPDLNGHGGARQAGYTRDPDGGMLELEPMPPPGHAYLGEWVTPISSDEPGHWNRSALALELIRRQPAATSHRTATHVHVSNPDYGDKLEAFTNLLGIFSKYEDVLYRMSGRPDLPPSSMESAGPLSKSVYMQAFSTTMNRGPKLRPLGYRKPNRLREEPYQDVPELLREQNKKHVAINLKGVKQGPDDHLEFRVPDATLQPEILQAYVTLCMQIVEKAAQAADGKIGLELSAREPIGTHFDRAGEPVPSDGERFMADTASFRGMLDELFDRNIDKARMTALFAITGWQPPEEQTSRVGRALAVAGWSASRVEDEVRNNPQYFGAALAVVLGSVLAAAKLRPRERQEAAEGAPLADPAQAGTGGAPPSSPPTNSA